MNSGRDRPLPNDDDSSSESLPTAEMLLADLLDGRDAAAPQISDPALLRRAAGVQFLHGLLSHIHRPEPASMEARIQRVMAAVRRTAGPGEPVAESIRTPVGANFTRRRSMLARFATVAGILAACGIVWTLVGTGGNAYAAVDRALIAAQQVLDREYRVSTQLRGPLGGQRAVKSTLYVRGGEYFALRHPAVLGGELWLGRHGSELWLIPRLGPVLVGQDASLEGTWREQAQVSTPYLQITTILQRLRERYRLETLPDEELPRMERESETALFQRLRGSLISTQDPRLPRVIDMWLDRESGAARRLQLDWQSPAEDWGVQSVQFDLAALPNLPADWYSHAAHHHAQRPVIQPPAGEARPHSN